jgi:hypothetical protein
MEERKDILNELLDLSPVLAGMEKVNVFTVPEGYFEGLSGSILSAATESHSSILGDLSKENTGKVPTGYFEDLPALILNRVKMQENITAPDELQALSPMLFSIKDINVFDVPRGYFNALSGDIVNRVQPRQTKVVVMHRRTMGFMRYAVAAAFTGVMALGVFKFTNTDLASGGGNAWTMNVDNELDKVSSDDIIKYLETNGEGVDALSVANKTVDENDLPSQADYLNDDKALDKYLDNANVNDLKN